MGREVHIISRVMLNGKPHVIVGTPAQAARARVSRQNRTEYDNEKRAKEIHNHFNGPSAAKAVAVAKMMSISESQAKRLIRKKSKGMVLDGKIN